MIPGEFSDPSTKRAGGALSVSYIRRDNVGLANADSDASVLEQLVPLW